MSILGILALVAAMASIMTRWGFLIAQRRYECEVSESKRAIQAARSDHFSIVGRNKATSALIRQVEQEKKNAEKSLRKQKEVLSGLQEEQDKEETLRRLQKEKLAELDPRN